MAEIKIIEPAAIEEVNAVNDFILQTLELTPLFFVKTQKFVEIKAYAPEANHLAMKIFRIISVHSIPSGKEGFKEVSFQDEIDILVKGKRSSMERWQINFSILVDEKTFKFHSIKNKPKKITHALESIKIFADLSKQKGAILYAGDWRFESDGNSWIKRGKKGQPELLDPALLLIER